MSEKAQQEGADQAQQDAEQEKENADQSQQEGSGTEHAV